ncbi:dihydrodipicolinate synthase family protein [Flexivirga caeni]|uniref:Dihydrodipicolinate synthase family protein n=1 Tax=Flexivirga caeni TaxID=2294115 RepID=A0A3M9MHC3_9MICO|nr:dihydrodipicolinate synthase family protein [Flexivirga caeni]RNI24263.1 dihydrodipicolinate synthase family protein [Flexivirga caeni]
MNRDDVDWYGYWAALPTPFDEDGALDENALASITRRVIDDGVHGILVNGSTGEWTAQSVDERRRVAEVVIATVAGRVPTAINVTAWTPTVAQQLAAHVAEAGGTSVMAAVPPGTRPTFQEANGYFRSIFESCPLPGWLYNFPQDSAARLSPTQLSALGDIDTVVAIKQSAPSTDELLQTIQLTGDRLRVFGHLITRLGVALISSGFGGDGCIGSGMLLGAQQPAFFDLVLEGRTSEALEIADRFEAMQFALRGDADDYNWRYGGMQASLKAAMNILGQAGGYPRKPKLPITDSHSLGRIRSGLVTAGQIPA